MNTGIQPQAVIGGNINFFPSLSTGILAAVSGLPLVIVLNFYDITPWMLVTSKDINKPQDLIGKKSRYLRYSNVAPLLFDGVVQKGGDQREGCRLHHDRWHRIELRILASGQVAGAVLTPPFDDKAVSRGFKKFMLIGDLVDIPTSGLVAARAEVMNHRDRVQKTISALLDAAPISAPIGRNPSG